MPLRKLNIGTYVSAAPVEGQDSFYPIATASLSTPVFDLVHMFSKRGISAVPIVDEDGIVVNLYETVDVIVSVPVASYLREAMANDISPSSVEQTLVRLGAYQSLDLTVSEALHQRSPDFPGVVICTASDSLGTLMQLIKKRRVHRLVVVEGEVCIIHLGRVFNL